MDLSTISALDLAFDHLLDAAAELRRAEVLAKDERLAAEARRLATAVEADIQVTHTTIRRALLS